MSQKYDNLSKIDSSENISILNHYMTRLRFLLKKGWTTKVSSLKFKKNSKEIEKSILGVRVITSPLKGELIPLTQVKDKAFSTEALGKGIAIGPIEGKVVAPFDGTVTTLFPSKHAIGLVSNNGVELLIYIGLNTINLNGKYFKAFVKQGQRVIKGETLISFDIDKIKQEGYIIQTPIVVTNTYEYNDVLNLSEGNISYNEGLLLVSCK